AQYFGRAFDVRCGGRHEPVGQAAGEVVDRHLHHRRAAVAAGRGAGREPREVAVAREARALPVLRVQPGQLLDDVGDTGLDVGVFAGGEAAAGSDEVFEHHHITVVGPGTGPVELRVPDARHAHRQLVREVAVKVRLHDT